MAELRIAQSGNNPGVAPDERHIDIESRVEGARLAHRKLLIKGGKALARVALAGIVVFIVLLAATVRFVTFGLVVISAILRSLLR